MKREEFGLRGTTDNADQECLTSNRGAVLLGLLPGETVPRKSFLEFKLQAEDDTLFPDKRLITL